MRRCVTPVTITQEIASTHLYVAGNEIAHHTTQVGDPPQDEINGNLTVLNTLSGILLTSIAGFHTPFFNYSVAMLKCLVAANFTYDPSTTSSIPVTDLGTDVYWLYTLDHGMANDCLEVEGSCKGQPVLPSFWEIPMYVFFDKLGVAGPHLMDPWLDNSNGESKINDTAMLEYMQDTFTKHYNRNRQPIGLYMHPIHLLTTYLGVNPPPPPVDHQHEQPVLRLGAGTAEWCIYPSFHGYSQTLRWNVTPVWIVSNEQLLTWVKNPVPVSQLDSIATPSSAPPPKSTPCSRSATYGCPEAVPTLENLFPIQAAPPDGAQQRFRIPTNCSTPFWDPVGNKCLCSRTACASQFMDNSQLIGLNGPNLTGSGTSALNASASSDLYQLFNGKGFSELAGMWGATIVGVGGALVGMAGVMGWF
ncbi:Carbohydrate esterase family 4 [Mycena venus]|uniref:Carbohydrate esterase family 4 n=1 Tax=Mycena venus TaxID=2733690 RepID=A0A8H6Z339_9AGAR|nr:Carbohydrate esterase family 4 [Mycena venus]